MKPLVLFSAPLAVCFVFVPDLWYPPSSPIFMLLLVEPPPSTLGILSDVLFLLLIISSVGSLVRISTYYKKEKKDNPVNGGVASIKVNHSFGMWLLFVTIVLDVLTIASFMITEPGMRPHPLAEPDRAAPLLIADPRTAESLFLLLGIIFASASMLSLFISQRKMERHGHCWSIIFAALCLLSVALAAIDYWFF